MVSETRIDEPFGRILSLKFDLRLFENLCIEVELAEAVTEKRELARRAATVSITLLENNGVLPLSAEVTNILVTGPSADSIVNHIGGLA